jgi:hypothetical protein
MAQMGYMIRLDKLISQFQPVENYKET